MDLAVVVVPPTLLALVTGAVAAAVTLLLPDVSLRTRGAEALLIVLDRGVEALLVVLDTLGALGGGGLIAFLFSP